jgi:serine/threonine-protein kinase OSR1/STK39
MQREEILRLIKYLEQTSAKQPGSPETNVDDLLQTPPATSRERELQSQVMLLQQSFSSLTEELKKQKQKNGQLENQLNALTHRND